MASLKVGNVGEFLREQRRTAKLSLRQLADAAGVSNPYLSQIERGLRKPSAEILQQLAKALRISAETMYVQAGILDEREREDLTQVPAAILADPSISELQKQALLQIYESFRKENAAAQDAKDVKETKEAKEAKDSGPGDGTDEDADANSGTDSASPGGDTSSAENGGGKSGRTGAV
jgi:transcriptional regulator with XRE-family HTH domain